MLWPNLERNVILIFVAILIITTMIVIQLEREDRIRIRAEQLQKQSAVHESARYVADPYSVEVRP